MSRLLKTSNVLVKSLHLPGGWRSKLDQANVAGLADELRAGRTLPPIRITKDFHVVQGFHRVAAHLDAKVPEVRADTVLYENDRELEIDQLSENARRKRPTDDDLRRLVELFKNSGTAVQEVDAEPKVGRPKEPETVAVEQAASAAGVSTKTVRRAVEKARPQPENSDAPKPPPINTFGLTDIPPAILETAREAQVIIDEADRLLRTAQGALARLEGLIGYPASLAQDIRRKVHAAAADVRFARPEALCPYCKADPRAETCSACGKTRLALAGQMKGLPPELLAEGAELRISLKGRFVPRTGT